MEYTVKITILGDKEQFPEDWHKQAISSVANLIERDYVCGEVPIYDEVDFRVVWKLIKGEE